MTTTWVAPARHGPRSHSTRPTLRRNSPLSILGHNHGFSADAPMIHSISIGDSSDDDIPKPMHFSALTRAILEDRPSGRTSSPPVEVHATKQQFESARSEEIRFDSRDSTSPKRTLRILRSPPAEDRSPPRIVHLSATSLRSSNLQHTGHEARISDSQFQPQESLQDELITPAPITRARPLRSRANSATSLRGRYGHSSSTGQSSSSGQDGSYRYVTSSSQDGSMDQGPASSFDSSTRGRSRPSGEALPGSLRVKRVPVGSGTFLRGAPVRRGIRIRNSDDEQSPIDDMRASAGAEEENQQQHVEHESASFRPSANNIMVQDFGLGAKTENRQPFSNAGNEKPVIHAVMHEEASNKVPRVHFRVPSYPPLIPSVHDQENEPPPTFKRNKSQASSMLGTADAKVQHSDRKDGMMRARSPERPALAIRSHNTPYRVPPSPPKMDMLETATASAGASTLKKKKARQVTINGKLFAIRGRLGKGGSSDVYRVMAENDKMFALKRVKLEDCNEETVRGYKGEIELLKKLDNVERVVRLFDWEVNEQAQSLSVLMEIGESDLNRVLSHRLHPENACLDLSFTRHYWAEMLACVSAVHAHEIVHSDLKPANFLLVQGRLKLIDFGIANAIDIDNTVNVHRETNVGTPNYMSPESLQDSNGAERVPGTAKLMKLGKPSDVWSLGCILYQMTYGKPPFAHIANQWNRVMAIINPAVSISYPATGVGDVYVPTSLRNTLRQCLNRDAKQRPTVEQLLGERRNGADPYSNRAHAFLFPDMESENTVPVTEDVLGQILQNVVNRCRDEKRGIPTDEEVKRYSRAFMEKLRESAAR